jgi:hypothetical protein
VEFLQFRYNLTTANKQIVPRLVRALSVYVNAVWATLFHKF